MNRRLLVMLVGGTALAAAGALIATAAPTGAVFIPGDQPVTEQQVLQKLQLDGYTNVQIIQQGRYFEALGSKDGKTTKVRVDSQTGRLASIDNDGDDDDD